MTSESEEVLLYRIEKYQDQEAIEYAGQPFVFSQTSLELVTDGEEVLSGEIMITAQIDANIHCVFYSNHYRMQCLTSEMSGANDVLKYRFDGAGLDDGEEVKGEFSLVSNVGEYRIPFVVRVEKVFQNEDLGKIKNLFHFTNLARENFQEAVEFFYKKEFLHLLTGHDKRYLGLYRGLAKTEMHARNVDTFLVAIGKKQPISYQVREEKLILKDIYQNQKETVTLERQGWGYTHVTVKAEGGFIDLPKDVLTAEDFENDVCELSFTIDPAKMRQNFQYGRLVFRYGDEETICDIIIRMPHLLEKRAQGRMEHKQLLAELMHRYMEYITGSPDPHACLKNAEKIIEKINSLYGRNVEGRLYQVHVLIELTRENEARWVLSHVENMLQKEEVSVDTYAYYLFLTACLEREENCTQKVLRKLHNYVLAGEGGAATVCLYLKLLPEQEAGSVKRLSMYEEQFLKGNVSPVMMRQAWEILESSMAYLTKLDSFEVALIRFAMKYGLFTKEAAQQINYLVKRKRDMSKALFQMLSMSYKIFPDDDTIQALCTLMIRLGIADADSYFWYALAVSRELRITSLYEYYMMSIDTTKQELLPKMVLMYFTYSCDLPDKKRAYLYHNIISHKREIMQIFTQYEQQIEQFGWQQMQKNVMSENHATIYRYLLSKEENLEKARDYLMKLAFVHMIKTQKKGIKNVIVIQDMLDGEQIYPLEKGVSFVNCYVEDYTILFEDGQGNRFYNQALYTDKRLMSVEKIAIFLQQHKEESIGFLLYQAYLKNDENLSNPDSCELYEKLALSEEIDRNWRIRMLDKLMSFYYERDESDKLADLIVRYPVEQADQKQRGQMIRYYVGCGMDQEAFSLLYEYGFEGVSAKVLARLLTRNINQEEAVDAKMLALTYYTYKQGKYTETMLAYLCLYFEEDIKKMRDIWRDAVAFDVDAVRIAERILLAHMFGNGYISQLEEVFVYYAQHGGRENIMKKYVMRHAYTCFVWQTQPQAEVFRYLQKYIASGQIQDKVSRLSYLYYMSHQKSFTPDEKDVITGLVEDFVYNNQYLPFFAQFIGFIPWLSFYTQHTYIEYRAKPGTKVMLHYMFDNEDTYVTKQMTEIGGGYYCERFLLLFSEKLRYYFVEQDNEEENATQSGILEKSDMTMEGSLSRMGMLGDIMISHSMGDEKTKQTLIKEYVHASYLHDLIGGALKWKS